VITWLQSLNWTQIAAIAVALASVFFGVKDKLPALKGLLPSSKAEPVDEDVADLAAIKRLEARAERRGCPKLAEAVAVVETNFFNRAPKAEAAK
jgi:hypothetical protein